MTKKVFLKLLSIASSAMLFSVIYETKLPFDKEQATFGVPHIMIQWLLAIVVIGLIIDLMIYTNKEHGWFS